MADLKRDNIRKHFHSLIIETFLTSWELIKITVPVIIITRILEQFGLIYTLSDFLAPVMGLIGLPGELGLVWATAMMTTLYGGLAVFAALVPTLDVSVAQVTVLCSAMLIAHSLPIELTISKKAGAPLIPIFLLRFLGALAYCFILDRFCTMAGIWQQPATLLFNSSAEPSSHLAWAIQQCRNIGLIILIIFCILLIMQILRSAGVLKLLERMLAPVLPWFGMTGEAAPVTVVGMIMGIGYGGALIIRETATGKMGRTEIFNSMVMMGLCHGLVEDTLIMMAMGGKLAGILWGRILFSLIVTFVLVRLFSLFSGRLAPAAKP